MSTSREQVLEVLKGLDAPGGDIVSSGVMRALNVDGGTV
ncbi:iron-sulfur cluster assembly protein, partial [uncultured Tateyamaria sp.]